MIYIISGTNRPQSRSLALSKYILSLYKQQGQNNVEIIDLAQLNLSQLDGSHYGAEAPDTAKLAIEKINKSSGLHFVVPEYNGSYPGILKYFIDHWTYPTTFESRPMAFVGLGFRFAGLRPVEHLQGVMGYRNAFIFPERVFIGNIAENFKDGKITDPLTEELLLKQITNFPKYIKALKSENLT